MNKIVIVLSIFLFASCKKGRICECNTSWTFQYSNGSGYDTRIFPSDSKGYTQGLTKHQAIKACEHQSSVIQTTFIDLVTDHGNDPLKSGEKVETKCNLK